MRASGLTLIPVQEPSDRTYTLQDGHSVLAGAMQRKLTFELPPRPLTPEKFASLPILHELVKEDVCQKHLVEGLVTELAEIAEKEDAQKELVKEDDVQKQLIEQEILQQKDFDASLVQPDLVQRALVRQKLVDKRLSLQTMSSHTTPNTSTHIRRGSKHEVTPHAPVSETHSASSPASLPDLDCEETFSSEPSPLPTPSPTCSTFKTVPSPPLPQTSLPTRYSDPKILTITPPPMRPNTSTLIPCPATGKPLILTHTYTSAGPTYTIQPVDTTHATGYTWWETPIPENTAEQRFRFEEYTCCDGVKRWENGLGDNNEEEGTHFGSLLRIGRALRGVGIVGTGDGRCLGGRR